MGSSFAQNSHRLNVQKKSVSLFDINPYAADADLLLTNLTSTKWWKRPEKSPKPWFMGTHLRGLLRAGLKNLCVLLLRTKAILALGWLKPWHPTILTFGRMREKSLTVTATWCASRNSRIFSVWFLLSSVIGSATRSHRPLIIKIARISAGRYLIVWLGILYWPMRVWSVHVIWHIKKHLSNKANFGKIFTKNCCTS